MRSPLSIAAVIIVILLNSCVQLPGPCGCCINVYQDDEAAFQCIENNPVEDEPIDNRLLLYAFTSRTEQADWNILGDAELVELAMRNYLLVIMDPDEISANENYSEEFLEVITNYKKSDLFFIISSSHGRDGHVWHHWDHQSNPEMAEDAIWIGVGP
jgi:hypothetical protein